MKGKIRYTIAIECEVDTIKYPNSFPDCQTMEEIADQAKRWLEDGTYGLEDVCQFGELEYFKVEVVDD